ncbi:hypothetical protein [Flavobacterium sp.]|uniref:hypothetical protein n=1 Tax=Flavobacterium sp. TaxID=239 RepID=UPI003F6A0FB3
MVTLEKLAKDLQINKFDEVLSGATTTKDGVAQSSGEDDWITYTTNGKGFLNLGIVIKL